MIGNLGSHGVNQTLYKRPLYNSMTDFAPIGLVNQGLFVLLVRKDFPASTLQEFTAYAKAAEAKLQFGSGGAGSTTHMVCVLLNMALSVQHHAHPLSRGTAPALQDLVGGRPDYQCEPLPTALAQIQGNAAGPSRSWRDKRSDVVPHISDRAEEQGLKDFEAYTWNALFLPKGTPDPIVRRLNAAMSQALDTPWVRERLAKLGLEVPEPDRRTPSHLATFLENQIKKWAAPIRKRAASRSSDITGHRRNNVKSGRPRGPPVSFLECGGVNHRARRDVVPQGQGGARRLWGSGARSRGSPTCRTQEQAWSPPLLSLFLLRLQRRNRPWSAAANSNCDPAQARHSRLSPLCRPARSSTLKNAPDEWCRVKLAGWSAA